MQNFKQQGNMFKSKGNKQKIDISTHKRMGILTKMVHTYSSKLAYSKLAIKFPKYIADIMIIHSSVMPVNKLLHKLRMITTFSFGLRNKHRSGWPPTD